MKDKTVIMNEPIRIKNLEWLYQEVEDDDFLLGKKSSNLEYAWEDEE